MTILGRKLVCLAFAISIGARTADSQSTNNLERCASIIIDSSFNASQVVPFFLPSHKDDLPGPWYLTLTLSDYRSENSNPVTRQSLATYLSVPQSLLETQKGKTARICAYRLNGLNATVDNAADSESSCTGMLSNKCIDALQRISSPKEEDDRCPEADVSNACGQAVKLSSLWPLNFTASGCEVDPNSSIHVDEKEPYQTYRGPSGDIVPGDGQASSFDMYDLRVRQAVPIVFTSSIDGKSERDQGDAAVICAAPDKIENGSRKPSSGFPPSAGCKARVSGGMVTLVALPFMIQYLVNV